MTDQELIQALRACANGRCQSCPQSKRYLRCSTRCITEVTRLAADKIANQQTNILALQKAIEDLRDQNEQLREAAALVTKESAELLECQWIPVTERLPGYNARVLAIDVYNGNGDEDIGIWTREEYPNDPDGCWIDDRGWWHALDEATHWMPLPEPPDVEKVLEAMKDV